MFKPLTKICNITTGKLDSNAAIKNGKYPFFTCAPEPLSIDTFAFDDDVILLAGNNAQGNFHLSRYCGKFNAYQRTYVITPKEGYNIDYIKYSIELSLEHLKKVAQGSQTKFLTMQILDGFLIADIPYSQQCEMIASIKAMDQKIQNNAHIRSELEAMAKTIYDYWFLQFDFPNTEGKPYRSSGGEMMWNKKLKSEIPLGWEATKISEECKTLLGGTPDTTVSEYWNGNIPWLSSGEIALSPIIKSDKTITESGLKNSTTAFANAGAVLLSITRYIRPSILAINACFNQSVVAIIPTSKLKTAFLYPFIMSQINRYMGLRTGAQQPHINKTTVDETVLVVPDEQVLENYYQLVEPMYNKILCLTKEIEELTNHRNWLLPILMNRQVRVA